MRRNKVFASVLVLALLVFGVVPALADWASSNASVATDSTTGVVTGVSTGTATIAVTANNGVKATSAITALSGPQPVTPCFQLPPGLENPISITIPGTVSESGLNSAAGATVEQTTGTSSSSSVNYLVLKNRIVSNILSHRGNSMHSHFAIKMPVFKALVSRAGRTGVVMFQLPSSSLAGYKAGVLIPVKAVSTLASESLSYDFVDSSSKLTDGKFGVVMSDKTTFMEIDELFEYGREYYIAFAIKDGGSLDMNNSEMYITDPVFVGLSIVEKAGSNGRGGCSTAAFVPAALLLVLPLLAILRERG